MDIFNLLTLIGGLSLFLFGMTIMGQALERRAGVELRSLLGKFTTNKMAGLLTGAGVTTVNSKLFGYYGYGSRFCKFRLDVAAAGNQCNYGCRMSAPQLQHGFSV